MANIPTLVTPIPSRENVDAKAIRLILERRLLVRLVKKDRIWAECRGSDTTYELGYAKGRWFCGCDGGMRGQTCSHLRALHHVVVRPDGDL